jgi:hypothetical protein
MYNFTLFILQAGGRHRRCRTRAIVAHESPGAHHRVSSSRPRLTFRDLDGDDFRHPLDKQNTSLLRSIPGLEIGARLLLGGPGFEQALYIENIAAAVKVGPTQYPTIYNLLKDACHRLDMSMPALYVRQVRTVLSGLAASHQCTQPCAQARWQTSGHQCAARSLRAVWMHHCVAPSPSTQ